MPTDPFRCLWSFEAGSPFPSTCLRVFQNGEAVGTAKLYNAQCCILLHVHIFVAAQEDTETDTRS